MASHSSVAAVETNRANQSGLAGKASLLMKQIHGASPCLARKLFPPEYPRFVLLWNALNCTPGYLGLPKFPHQRVFALNHFSTRSVRSCGSSLALSSTHSLYATSSVFWAMCVKKLLVTGDWL